MRYVSVGILATLLISMSTCVSTLAISVAPSDQTVVRTEPPLSITSYSTTAHRLNYVQLYNASNQVQDLDGWKLFYTVEGVELSLTVQLDGLLAPGRSVLAADEVTVPNALFLYVAPEVYPTDTIRISQIRLAAPDDSSYLDQIVSPTYPTGSPQTMYVTRNRSSATGNYLTSFSNSLAPPAILTQDTLYEYPETASLRVIEVLANSRNCSPLETAADCKEYVKIFNPTADSIDLGSYRLRTGYQGQAASSSNTIYLSGEIAPGGYLSFPISLVNSGGWVWIEDMFGMKRYDETVVEYASAGSESKKGLSWAQSEDGLWSWASPRPNGENVLLSLEEINSPTTPLKPCNPDQFRNPETGRCKKIETQSSLTPCRADQYRSEETNRCRTIATASSLTPCATNQYRSPETNRCRNLSTTSSSLVPCKVGQYRSTETNRCRSLTAATSELKPCAANQERNPETNRCRKSILGDADVGFEVVDTPASSDQTLSWLALGGLGFASLGYAGWEWRRELIGGVGKLLRLLPFVK